MVSLCMFYYFAVVWVICNHTLNAQPMEANGEINKWLDNSPPWTFAGRVCCPTLVHRLSWLYWSSLPPSSIFLSSPSVLNPPLSVRGNQKSLKHVRTNLELPYDMRTHVHIHNKTELTIHCMWTRRVALQYNKAICHGKATFTHTCIARKHAMSHWAISKCTALWVT